MDYFCNICTCSLSTHSACSIYNAIRPEASKEIWLNCSDTRFFFAVAFENGFELQVPFIALYLQNNQRVPCCVCTVYTRYLSQSISIIEIENQCKEMLSIQERRNEREKMLKFIFIKPTAANNNGALLLKLIIMMLKSNRLFILRFLHPLNPKKKMKKFAAFSADCITRNNLQLN